MDALNIDSETEADQKLDIISDGWNNLEPGENFVKQDTFTLYF